VSVSLSEEKGFYAPPLAWYILRVHGRAGTGVTVDGQPAAGLAGYENLRNGSTEGWASGTDKYGPVTWIKVGSRAAKSVIISGQAAAP
jgi:hypothetical protein